MSVFFEYSWQPTIFHRMHPFTKLGITVLVGILVTLWWDYIFALPLCVLLFALARVAKVPKHWYNVIWAAWGIYAPLRLLIFPYAYAWEFKVYPSEFVNKMLLYLTPPGTPIIGEVYFTVGSVLYIGMMLIHAASYLLLIMILMYSTSVTDFCNALARYGAPSYILFLIMSIYRFTSIFQRQMMKIIDAQKLRGWELTKNPVVALRRAAPLLFPFTRLSINVVTEVTLATEIRAFGARKIAPIGIITWPKREKVLLIILALIVIVAVWAEYFSGYWIGLM